MAAGARRPLYLEIRLDSSLNTDALLAVAKRFAVEQGKFPFLQ
jgi:hypothetical protein